MMGMGGWCMEITMVGSWCVPGEIWLETVSVSVPFAEEGDGYFGGALTGEGG